MSRHLLTCDDPALVLWVGWDEGLGTFFAQVEPPGAARPEDLLLWIGQLPSDVVDLGELADLVRRWARLDDATIAILEGDRCARR
ncbi:MAG: hypothetical protein ACRD2W_11360 [Acidimicrobiales bacterium]